MCLSHVNSKRVYDATYQLILFKPDIFFVKTDINIIFFRFKQINIKSDYKIIF